MARTVALVALLCLLAGCASSPNETAPVPNSPPTDDPAGAAPTDPAGPQAAGGQQTEDLAWLVSGVACAHANPTQGAIYETLLPELDGITFASAAVDPASIGQPWTVTAADALTLVGFEVTFWKGAVGPGGEALTFQVGLPPFEGDFTVEGEVPEGTEFVSVFACSAEPGSATYVADLLPALAFL